MRQYFVYVMASVSRTLYVGMTNNLERPVFEHKGKETPGFTRHYNVTRLVCIEAYGDPRSAIAREKQIKGWRRSTKIELIEAENPEWADLSDGWFDG